VVLPHTAHLPAAHLPDNQRTASQCQEPGGGRVLRTQNQQLSPTTPPAGCRFFTCGLSSPGFTATNSRVAAEMSTAPGDSTELCVLRFTFEQT
jgi:hypothetical protein